MFQSKIRRAAASAALLCALSLLPTDAALAARSSRSLRSQRPAAAVPAGTFWGFVTGLLGKFGVVIDPNGSQVNLRADRVDPDGNSVSDPESIR